MEIHLRIIGTLLVMLALVHLYFPRYFDWKRDFSTVSIVNRQMFYVHSFFIAFVVLLMGILCLTSAQELVNTSLGKKICLCLGVFWLARLVIQFFGYSSQLWKGKTFETTIHVVFSIFWTYMSLTFIIAYL
ncbi:hypothetical protein [Flavihumibacter solisilvae]|uniref:Uncharacterized protein n=1 Tax=Flavihumibacter solisilvae TaxID=1349421 RepID=A0A0C1L0L9_9BACT|nr:hypothetical protein [Flavihumibacter solisilvae]KIC93532.1 hypothetical protein OI18_17435 [Flavihumibacter solisilvae]